MQHTVQTSGWHRGPDEDGNKEHCFGCLSAIQDALKLIPRKTQEDWALTTDISVRDLVAKQAHPVQAHVVGGKPIYQIRRIWAPLFDLGDLSNTNLVDVVRHAGRTYRYSYWTKLGMDSGEVTIQVERELATGKILGPWELTDFWETWPTFIEPTKQGSQE